MKILMKKILKMSQELMILESLFYSSERNFKKNTPILATQQSTYYVPVIKTAFLKSDGK